MAAIVYDQAEVIAIGAVFPVVCGVFVGLRFYARRVQRTPLGIDDWLIVPAYLTLVGMCASIIAGGVLGGLGTWSPPAKDNDSLGSSYPRRIAREVLYATKLLQTLNLGFVKCSFLFLYRRIFFTTRQSWSHGIFNAVNILMIVVIISWTISFFFAFLFQCGTNMWAYYGSTQTYEQDNCVKTTVLNDSFAISDMITDFIIIMMPIPVVVKLQMTFRRKLAVVGIFFLGGLALVASIMRLAIYIQTNTYLFTGKFDVDMLTTGGIYWSTLESGLAMMAACLPILYRLFHSEGITSMIRSVRSAISLQTLSSRHSSNKSKGSKASKTTNITKQVHDAESQVSNASMIHVETPADPDINGSRNEHELAQVSRIQDSFSTRS